MAPSSLQEQKTYLYPYGLANKRCRIVLYTFNTREPTKEGTFRMLFAQFVVQPHKTYSRNNKHIESINKQQLRGKTASGVEKMKTVGIKPFLTMKNKLVHLPTYAPLCIWRLLCTRRLNNMLLNTLQVSFPRKVATVSQILHTRDHIHPKRHVGYYSFLPVYKNEKSTSFSHDWLNKSQPIP